MHISNLIILRYNLYPDFNMDMSVYLLHMMSGCILPLPVRVPEFLPFLWKKHRAGDDLSFDT